MIYLFRTQKAAKRAHSNTEHTLLSLYLAFNPERAMENDVGGHACFVSFTVFMKWYSWSCEKLSTYFWNKWHYQVIKSTP